MGILLATAIMQTTSLRKRIFPLLSIIFIQLLINTFLINALLRLSQTVVISKVIEFDSFPSSVISAELSLT